MLKRLPNPIIPRHEPEVITRIPYPYAPSPQESWRVWGVVAGLLVSAWLVLVWPWLSGTVTIPWDAKAHFQAQISFLAQSLHNGQSPFWTPYVFGGHPQIADPQSLIFSPPHLLLALLMPEPSFRAMDMLSFGMLLFGAFGVLGFARDRHWHPAAALVAAMAFAFGGSAAWRIQHTGQIFSLLYFPWAFWMLERALRLHSRRYGALAGLFSALILLDPDQVAFLCLITFAGTVLAYWLGGPGKMDRLKRSFQPLLAGVLAGGVITLIPMLMVLSFAESSNRPAFSITEAELGSLHPSSLLTMLIANLYGTIGPAETFWGAPSTHWPYIVNSYLSRNMSNFYMGLLPLTGVVLWLSSAQAYRRRFLMLGVMFFAMILYALGRYTPLFELVYHSLPGVDLFRRPADSLFLVSAIGAFLAGFGLDLALRHKLVLAKGAKFALGGFLLLGFAAGIGMALWLGKFWQAAPDIALAAGFCGLTALVLVVSRRHLAEKPVLIAALFGLVLTLDYGINLRANDSTGLPPAEYDAMRPETQNDTIAALKSMVVNGQARRDRVEIAFIGFHWPNLGLVHGLENTLGYNPLRLRHYATATGAEDQAAVPDQHHFGPLFPSYRSPLANLLGLRFIAIGAPIETLDPSEKGNPLPLVARTKDAYIYENPDALPRVMVVPEAQIVDQDKLVQSGQWPSTDFRRLAFIEKTALPLPRGKTGGTARIVSYTNTEIVIETGTQKGGVLLLNDIWHPWWFARIDGKPTPVLRANGVFRAVILPAGVKQVEFRFEPFRGLLRSLFVRAGMLAL